MLGMLLLQTELNGKGRQQPMIIKLIMVLLAAMPWRVRQRVLVVRVAQEPIPTAHQP